MQHHHRNPVEGVVGHVDVEEVIVQVGPASQQIRGEEQVLQVAHRGVQLLVVENQDEQDFTQQQHHEEEDENGIESLQIGHSPPQHVLPLLVEDIVFPLENVDDLVLEPSVLAL